MRRWAELVAATTLLTRLPVGRLATNHPPHHASVWAYPLVGLVVGGVGAGVLVVGMRAGLPQHIAALWALAATVLVTGGLHEDGLADTADGFGGGASVERKLAIMRDSRIGSYGAIALAFSLALRAVPLGTSRHPELAILCASMSARGALLVPLLLLHPARSDGQAATLIAGGHGPAWVGLAITLALCVWVPAATLGALATAVGLTALTYRQVGGYTGDTLGAVEQVAECAAYSILAT